MKIKLTACSLLMPFLSLADSNKIPYPFTYCIVSGERFSGIMGEPVMIDYKNREVKFCCKGCVKEYYANPEFFLRKIDAIVSDTQ